MPDPTGGMFEASLKLKDESSDTLDGITDKIETAVKSTDDLQDEFKGLGERLDDVHKQTKDILDDTKDLGLIGASLLGTRGKGSIKEQVRDTQGFITDYAKTLGGILVDSTLSFANVALKAAGAAATLSSVLSGEIVLAQFPGMLAGGVVEATKLVGAIENLRHSMRLTNQEAAGLGPNISNTMLQTSADIELVVESLRELGDEAQLATPSTQQLAKSSVYMAEAWRMNVSELTRFNVQLARLYEVGPNNLESVASAMDHVARSTRTSREEIVELVTSLREDLIYKIPKEFRAKVMPRMLADISAIAGGMKDVFGDPRDVKQSFDKVLDVFNTEGQRMKAMIVGLGGATQEEMNKIVDPSNADAGGFWVAQVTAIENLKKKLGSKDFTRTAGIYAEQMGITREAFMQMSEITSKSARERVKETREAAESTKALRDAWDRAQGVFNEVWKRLENIGKAILIGIGEPLLKIITPAIDKLGKALQWIIEIFQGFGEGEKKLVGIAAILGTVAQAFQIGFGWFVTTALPWLIGTALPAVAAFFAAYILPVVLSVGSALATVGAAIVGVIAYLKAAMDFSSAFMEGFAPAVDTLISMLKVVGALLLAVFAPVSIVIAALIEHWDVFYDTLKPALDEFAAVWEMLKDVFRSVGSEMAKAFGTAEDGSASFFDSISEVLKGVAWAVGWVVKIIVRALALVVGVLGVAGAVAMTLLTPVIAIFGSIYDIIMNIAEAITDTIGYFKTFYDLITQGDYEGAFKAFGKGLARMVVGVVQLVVDMLKGVLNSIIKTFNVLPGIEIPTLEWDLSKLVGLKDGGITTKDEVPAILHNNEAVIPLEKFPEIVGTTVNVEQKAVVDELKRVRSVLERLSRRGGLGASMQGA